MPLTLNIGLSRKVGEPNYGSRGAMVNVQVELDAALVAEPEKFRDKVRALFALVRSSLTEELNGNGHAAAGPALRNGTAPVKGHGAAPAPPAIQPPRDGALPARNDPRGTSPRLATASQVKAIWAISKGQQLDLRQLLRERFRFSRPDDLTLAEASHLIDELKEAESGEG